MQVSNPFQEKSVAKRGVFLPKFTVFFLKKHSIFLGDQNFNIKFGFGPNTEVYCSCSFKLDNEMYIIGGYEHKRQLSKISKCQLSRLSKDLPFDFSQGACAVTENIAFLCFDYENFKTCYRTTDLENFEQLTNSSYSHRAIRIAASKGIYQKRYS